MKIQETLELLHANVNKVGNLIEQIQLAKQMGDDSHFTYSKNNAAETSFKCQQMIEELMVAETWVRPEAGLPARDVGSRYSQVPCLVLRNGQVEILQYNHQHECWDDADGDDYVCDTNDVECWKYVPKPIK